MSFELLEIEKIQAALHPINKEKLSKLEIFDSIDSTNSYLLEQTKHNVITPRVCFAEEQTQGRGRRGRDWFSPKGGNLYCSLLWQITGEIKNLSSLSLTIAIILVEALQKYGISGVGVKWPNDILFHGKKLGGILIERTGHFIVIGFGLNITLPQPALLNDWIDLSSISATKISRNFLAGLILNELLEKLPVFFAKGFTEFFSQWNKLNVLFEKNIVVHLADKIIPGIMKGINEEGELLLLDENNQIQKFCYGEVSVR